MVGIIPLSSVYIIFLALFIGIIVIGINRAKIKGKLGEKKVTSILNGLSDEYTIFNNVYLNENGRDNQIDHVVLSPYGIFVIETKNYKGWIYGGENAQYWTQNIYGRKYQLYNPILQNNAHVIALRSLFQFS